MKKALLYLSYCISLTCAMTVWQFNFGFRLAIYDILIIIFIFLAISYFFFKEEKILIDSNLKILVFFLFSWLILIMLSSQVILTNFPNPESISQYMKGLFNVIIRAMFLILFVFFSFNFKLFTKK